MREINKSKIGKIILFICALTFAIASLVCWFLPAINSSKTMLAGVSSQKINGLTLAFGGEISVTLIYPGAEKSIIPIYPVPIITMSYILMVIGLICCVLSLLFLARDKTNNVWKILIIATSVCFIVGGILCLFMPNFLKMSNQDSRFSAYQKNMSLSTEMFPLYTITSITCAAINCLQFFVAKKD